MHPKDKIPLHLKENMVYRWTCPEESCHQSYICESIRYLENVVKEHSSHITSVIYFHGESNNYPHDNISHFKLIDQDRKQVAREARKAIHIRINNLALSHNRGKLYIPWMYNNLLGADRPSYLSVQMAEPALQQGHTHLTIPSNRFSRTVCLAT